MGFFGSTKVYVSSTLQNLAGPIEDRPSFLKTAVVGSVLTGQPSIADTLKESYLGGPGIKLRRFFDWAAENHNVPTGTLASVPEMNNTVIKGYLPADSTIQKVEVDTANYSYWAEQYVMANYPAEVGTNWTAEQLPSGNIQITFDDTTTTSFTPSGMDPEKVYLYVTYVEGTTNYASGPFLYIYEIGSGNADLDSQVIDGDDYNQFFPMIPIKFDGYWIDDPAFASGFATQEKAVKKSIRGDLTKIIEEVRNSENEADMDYVSIMFAVPANTKDNSARKYLYDFFKKLEISQIVGFTDYNTYSTSSYLTYNFNYTEYQLQDQAMREDPLIYAIPEYTIYDATSLPKNSLRLRTAGSYMMPVKLDMEIAWQEIEEITGTGLAKPDAKVGEVWFDTGGSDVFRVNAYAEGLEYTGASNVVDVVHLYEQVSATSWKALRLRGLVHKNKIYGENSVEITLKEALNDAEESGFLVPLHSPTVRDMSLVHATQMSTSCAYMVINSYEVVKTGILGSMFFKVFLVVAVIAVTVATGGAGASTVGVLGTNAAVGAALGATGITAVIVGAVANAIAAMVITSLIQQGISSVIGGKLGAIISFTVAILAMNGLANITGNGNFAINFGTISDPRNLANIASTVAQGAQAYMGAEMQEILEATQELIDDYKEQSEEIAELYAENIGYGNGSINALALTDAGSLYHAEGPGSFLERTLMTGSDIAELSLSLVSNFTEISLNTDPTL